MLTRIAPSLAVAYWVRVHSAQFGAQMPTRSPLPMPAAEQAEGEGVDLVLQLAVAVAQAGRESTRARRSG